MSTHTCRLMPVVFFYPVEPPRARLLGRPHRLAVGDPGRRLLVSAPRPGGPARRRASSIRSQVPSLCHSWKYQKAVFQYGNSAGQRPPGAPRRTTYRTASTRSRRLYFGGRPPRLVGRDQGLQDGPLGVGQPGRVLARRTDIRVGFMPPKLALTNQRIQGYFPTGSLRRSSGSPSSFLDGVFCCPSAKVSFVYRSRVASSCIAYTGGAHL